MKIDKVRAAVVGTTLSGATAAALIGGAGPALAYDSGGLHLDAKAQSPAYLVANGAALRIPVDSSCNAPQSYLYLNIAENVDGRIASGSMSAELPCTGGHRTTLVTVTAISARAFAPGRAVATAQISGCSFEYATCGSETRTRTITIRR